MHYRNIYWDEQVLGDAHRSASVLAIGDSWFWYPFPGGSLLHALSPALETRDHVVYAVGRNGAAAYDYVHGIYKRLVDDALERHGDGLSAVFVSGGGNDFAGYNDLRPLLGANCAEAADAAACFVDENGNDKLAPFMRAVGEHVAALLRKIFSCVDDEVVVLLHNYDYARPTGAGVAGEPWLLPALQAAKVPAHLRAACIELLIDRYTEALRTLAAASPRIEVVDTRSTLGRSDWANELHPTPAGFAKLAARWRGTLREHALCA